MWFNTAAFIPNPAGTDGTAGRNILDGPGLRNVDLGIFRNFKFRERTQLQVRAELSNALNFVNLQINPGAPTGNLNSNLFGAIRTAADMRQVQLGLRLAF